MEDAALQVRNRLLGELQPSLNNARTHDHAQIAKIARSIERFGFNNPILIDRDDRVIAGHGRLQAAKLLSLRTVPTVCLDHLGEDERRAYMLADNRLAELADWDDECLALELEFLVEADLDIEVVDIGFETAEVDAILTRAARADPLAEEPPLGPLQGPVVTRAGEIWSIGKHRLLCGDSTKSESYDQLLGGEQAIMVFADPPYNLRIEGFVGGKGRHRHGEFKMASGEMTSAGYLRFLAGIFRQLVRASTHGSIHFICGDWRHLEELLRAGRLSYSELKGLCVWDKGNAGLGSLYRSQHELVAVFKSGEGKHINNVRLGKHRYRTNLWRYDGLNAGHADRDAKLAMHPTIKPVAMVADAMMDCSKRGDLVLDPFVGSGTAIIAAERTGRRCFAIELDPRHVDTAIARVQAATGLEAVSQATGRTFSEFRSKGDIELGRRNLRRS